MDDLKQVSLTRTGRQHALYRPAWRYLLGYHRRLWERIYDEPTRLLESGYQFRVLEPHSRTSCLRRCEMAWTSVLLRSVNSRHYLRKIDSFFDSPWGSAMFVDTCTVFDVVVASQPRLRFFLAQQHLHLIINAMSDFLSNSFPGIFLIFIGRTLGNRSLIRSLWPYQILRIL